MLADAVRYQLQGGLTEVRVAIGTACGSNPRRSLFQGTLLTYADVCYADVCGRMLVLLAEELRRSLFQGKLLTYADVCYADVCGRMRTYAGTACRGTAPLALSR